MKNLLQRKKVNRDIIEDIAVWNYARGNTEYKRGLEYRMISEELEEFLQSDSEQNEAKEIADIIFVAIGTLYKMTGTKEKAEAVLEAVIDANFAKGSKKIDGKIVKGKAYASPEKKIRSIIDENGQTNWTKYMGNEHIWR